MSIEDIQERKERALQLLPALREELGEEAAEVGDVNLLKFLHWKTDVRRAAERFRAHAKWRRQNPFAFDATPLRAADDPELKRVLTSEVLVAPEGLTDKEGNTVLIGRLRNNDMADGRTVEGVARMAFYMLDRALERESTQLHGVTLFHDLKGLSRKNIHPGIPKIVLGGIIGHFPIRIKAIYVLNAPTFFKLLFSAVSAAMFPKKLRERVHFISDVDVIYEQIDKVQLLSEHGGNREHITADWVEEQIRRERDGAFDSLEECYTP